MAVSASPIANLRSPNPPSKAPGPTPNVANVVLGNLHIKPWYPSFYPEELIGRQAEWLYVCQWCFKYTGEIVKFAEHGKACPLRNSPPPGEVIYTKDDVEIREVDGEEHKLYCQNLSLFAKLFLETKSVFFDAGTFLYYTLTLKSGSACVPTSAHPTRNTTGSNDSSPSGPVAGFFSKEKLSWDSNTLACILVFPPYQHRGLGQILIAASYHLGRREKRFGGPEKPLSSLGRRGFLAYWSREVAQWALTQPKQRTVKLKTMSEALWILPEDVLDAVRWMGVCGDEEEEGGGGGAEAGSAGYGGGGGRVTKSGSVVVDRARVRAWAAKHGVNLKKPVVDVGAFTLAGRVGQENEDEMED